MAGEGTEGSSSTTTPNVDVQYQSERTSDIPNMHLLHRGKRGEREYPITLVSNGSILEHGTSTALVLLITFLQRALEPKMVTQTMPSLPAMKKSRIQELLSLIVFCHTFDPSPFSESFHDLNGSINPSCELDRDHHLPHTASTVVKQTLTAAHIPTPSSND